MSTMRFMFSGWNIIKILPGLRQLSVTEIHFTQRISNHNVSKFRRLIMRRFSFVTLLTIIVPTLSNSKFKGEDFEKYRNEIKKMFYHGYNNYMDHAFPYDELRPLTCDGFDSWGSYSLTLIDSLDTLAVLGNFTEFRRVAELLQFHLDFNEDINVSVFETNIRVVGGLLSAHLLSKRAGIIVGPEWPCKGPLLSMAKEIATKLLPAFDTPSGMPYGTVNLMQGVPKGETAVTCTSGVGTFIVEFGTLSRLTGDPVYEETALRALDALWNCRSQIGLVGNHINVQTQKWTAMDSGIGGGIDSYLEYLVKGSLLLGNQTLMDMFREYEQSLKNFTKRDDWYMWVNMKKGQVTLPVFQSLDAYWPGLQSLIGDIDPAMKTLHNFHQVWKQIGFTPEFYNIIHGVAVDKREGYPLRPELIESVMYLYQATKDPFLLEVGRDILTTIQVSAKTPCGYASVKDVRYHSLDNRMESFFLSETTKYLYLLFDPDNFLNANGSEGTIVTTPDGTCVVDAGGYIFNTEAHPIDVGALDCCQHGAEMKELESMIRKLSGRGERLKWLKHRINQGENGSKTPGLMTNINCTSQRFSAKLSILGEMFPDFED